MSLKVIAEEYLTAISGMRSRGLQRPLGQPVPHPDRQDHPQRREHRLGGAGRSRKISPRRPSPF